MKTLKGKHIISGECFDPVSRVFLLDTGGGITSCPNSSRNALAVKYILPKCGNVTFISIPPLHHI